MDIFETLKQFKKITANAEYRERSKREILAHVPFEPRPAFGIGRALAAILETGIAVALTVFFILIIVGKFPGQSSVTPVQFSVIDPSTLKAEAQAVDIQIQLAQIAYNESSTVAASTPATTAAIAARKPTFAAATMNAAAGAASSSSSVASSTGTSTLSIDQALDQLSQ